MVKARDRIDIIPPILRLLTSLFNETGNSTNTEIGILIIALTNMVSISDLFNPAASKVYYIICWIKIW